MSLESFFEGGKGDKRPKDNVGNADTAEPETAKNIVYSIGNMISTT